MTAMTKFKFIRNILLIIFLVQGYQAAGQVAILNYFESDFETSEEQAKWHFEPDTTFGWIYRDGGDNKSPLHAASGSFNAHFFYSASEPIYCKIVSSPIDLSTAGNPQLFFQYAQPEDVFENRIKVLFRDNDNAVWDTIPFDEENQNNWKEKQYSLKEIDEKYLSSTFRVAFLAVNNFVNGVSIDSVYVVEQDTIPRFVKKIEYSPVANEIITSKAKQVPLVRLKINTSGNEGTNVLKKVAFKLNQGEESYFKTSGFKLFFTSGDVFKNVVGDSSTQIGNNVSIAGGKIEFSGINQNLFLGDNYLWLTANFADNVEHNSSFSIGVEESSLQVDDTLLPTSAINSVTSGVIKEAVFYDNFLADKGWTLQGDFERNAPQGFVSGTAKDPDYAFSDSTVLGTDLTGDGLYAENIGPGSEYYAYSPVVNLKYYDKVKLYMRHWNSFDFDDSASIDISNDGGSTWIPIWQSINHPENISRWREELFDESIKSLVSRQENVQIRFGIKKTGTNPKMGFNIDQFTVAGNHLDVDLGITEIISPYDDCIGFNNDTVKVVVKNYAENASPSTIPMYFALKGKGGGNLVVRDTIRQSIAKDDSLIFIFNELANFPKGDVYDKFTVGIELETDEDHTNDSLVKRLFIQNTITPPFLTDFEDNNGGVWLPDTLVDKYWLHGVPGNTPPSPTPPKAWSLYPYGNYENNVTRSIVSGCYNLEDENRYIIELNYNLLTAGANKDGFAIEYSQNSGQTWNLVDTSVYGRNWNWYTENIDALGHIGFSDNVGDWETAKELLPDFVGNKNKVKFRVVFSSDSDDIARGLSFDDFNIYPAPGDIGVSSISKPFDTCQFVNTDTVEVYVKNFGFNNIQSNDSVVVGVDFQNINVAIDTFVFESDLAPNDSVLIKLPTSITMDLAQTYNIKAYTLYEDDAHFYGTSNDTLYKQFSVWGNPITDMYDSLFSRQPDTLIIRPRKDPDYTYKWFDGSVADTHTVSTSDIYYSVTVTEKQKGCITKDSTFVQLLFNDVGVDEIVSPVSTCELTSSEYIEIAIKNKGTDSLVVGDVIDVYYTVDGATPIHNKITLTAPLYKNEVIYHTFTVPYDFENTTDYVLTTYTDFGGDTVGTNDTVRNTISVYGYTPLDLGPDYTITALTETLDAGAGFVEYLWSTGENTQTIVIDTAGIFYVDAIDANGCPATDTINVYLKIHDLEVLGIISPSVELPDWCDRGAATTLVVNIHNNGTDTIKVTDDVNISFSVDGGAVNSEKLSLATQLLPGGSTAHSFVSQVDLSAYKTHSINFDVSTAGDMRPANNDTIIQLATKETPKVDLGADRTVNGTSTELDAGSPMPNLKYLWKGGSTAQKLVASVTDSYWVTVTDTISGCVGKDTILLTFDVTDYAVSSVEIENTPCQKVYKDLDVEILNNGTYARLNAVIKVGVKFNSDPEIVEEFVIEGNWAPNEKKTVEFTQEISTFKYQGVTQLEVFLQQQADLSPGNDLLQKTLNIQEAAFVDLGPDTLGVTVPYTLDATAPGDNRYFWGDGSEGPTLTVLVVPAEYVVSVVSSNACVTNESIYLTPPSSTNEYANKVMNLDIYPNPVEDVLTIEADLTTGEEVLIEMVDVTNRMIFSETHKGFERYEKALDVKEIPKGVYFVRVYNEKLFSITQLIVK